MSLQAPKSFFGGTFFGGEFFDQKAYGHAFPQPYRDPIPAVLRVRRPGLQDKLRSRGKFQVEITAEELIELVAGRHLDSSDAEMVADLKRQFADRFMDWEPQYAPHMHRARARLVAERDARLAAEAQARNEWLRRRQVKVRRMH